MKRIVLPLVLLFASPAAASVEPLPSESHAFCTDPPRPLSRHARRLCPLAQDVPDCEPLRAACATDDAANKPEPWLVDLLSALAPFAKFLLYGLVLAIVAVVAIPLFHALHRWQRSERVAPLADRANVAEPWSPPTPAPDAAIDPERTLAAADASHEAGDDRRALALYLAASLSALDRRGALRLGRDRTNGEYVRACKDDDARPALRAIVLEVDRADFGGVAPTPTAVGEVATRARALVRAAAIATTLLLLGCNRTGNADPAGEELPTRVLAANGFHVAPLRASLASLPVEDALTAGIVVVDLERVPLEDETRIHLERWVEAGGRLVLLGHASDWPSRLGVTLADEGRKDVRLEDGDLDPGVLARPDALRWPGAEIVARAGDTPYAAEAPLGNGRVLGIANDDLFTNLGVLPPHNAELLVEIFRVLAEEPLPALRIAGAEDGVPPPSNPFAALAAAGLAKGAWHALAAALVLILAFGIRHARPRPERPTTRRAFAEHVTATGALYARTDAGAHALRTFARFVELRLRELAPRGTDPVTWLAHRADVPAARIQELLARGSAKEEPAGDELKLLEELRSIVASTRR